MALEANVSFISFVYHISMGLLLLSPLVPLFLMRAANSWGKLFYFVGITMTASFVGLVGYVSTHSAGCFEGCSGRVKIVSSKELIIITAINFSFLIFVFYTCIASNNKLLQLRSYLNEQDSDEK